jgi:hypothetical protein
MDRDHQELPQESQPSRSGELRAYALVVLVLVTLLALLWAVQVRAGLLVAFIVLFCIAAPFGNMLIGPAEYVQIDSPTFERRIRNRYRSEFNKLTEIGFKPLFSFGEATPLFRFLLIYPIFLYAIMLLNREIAAVKGSKLIFGYPVLSSSDGTTYVHIMQLGMKFYTRFQDGTILLTKSFGGATTYGPNVIFQRLCNAAVSDIWIEHHNRVRLLEATGKQVDGEISFAVFSRISAEA